MLWLSASAMAHLLIGSAGNSACVSHLVPSPLLCMRAAPALCKEVTPHSGQGWLCSFPRQGSFLWGLQDGLSHRSGGCWDARGCPGVLVGKNRFWGAASPWTLTHVGRESPDFPSPGPMSTPGNVSLGVLGRVLACGIRFVWSGGWDARWPVRCFVFQVPRAAARAGLQVWWFPCLVTLATAGGWCNLGARQSWSSCVCVLSVAAG